MILDPIEFPTAEAKIFLAGPVGQLEVLTHQPSNNRRKVVGIVCHPHPLFGGTMHNKVVYTIARAFKELGLFTVRFNFRGIGSSAGSYGEGIGEVEDLLAVVRWVKTVCPQYDIWLAGFSFGSYIATRAAAKVAPGQLICVAPPVQSFDFKQLDIPDCPWLIIQGDEDEIVSATAVVNWVDKLHPQPDFVLMPNASHFFHGKLVELRETLIMKLQK